MKEIQIYEVADTNLLYVVTDANSDATYYTKTNLEVEAVDGFVVLRNEGIEVLKELPKHFVNPVESSVVDMVEIIQGYINNLVKEDSETVSKLDEIITQNKERNELLNTVRRNTKSLETLIGLMVEQNALIKEMF